MFQNSTSEGISRWQRRIGPRVIDEALQLLSVRNAPVVVPKIAIVVEALDKKVRIIGNLCYPRAACRRPRCVWIGCPYQAREVILDCSIAKIEKAWRWP